VTAVAAGSTSSCAVQASVVKCWGSNSQGQLGSDAASPALEPVAVSGIGAATDVTIGNRHACAIGSGAAKCWGSNDSGQLGDGTSLTSSTPVQPTGLTSGVTSIAAGSDHTCAVVDGSAKCWGFGRALGSNTIETARNPVQVQGLTSDVTAVTAGGGHSCAIVDGGARCWGVGTSGQLGDAAATTRLVPVQVVGLTSGVTAISGGGLTTCAVVSGSAMCWGTSTSGGLGTGSTAAALSPAQVSGLTSDVTAIDPGSSHTCAITAGALSCWGMASTGLLGHLDMRVPNKVVGGSTWASPPPAPTISGSRSPAANAAGWNNEPVVVSFACESAALESCTSPVTVSADGADQSVTGTVTDTGGQAAFATVSGISIDRTLPSLAGVATTAANAAGWYNAPVTMAWTCSDALSGISPGSCPASSTTTGEGSAVSLSASVSDRAGNQVTASSESVKVDTTKPSTGVSSPSTWSKDDVTLTLSPTDGLSGVASTSFRIDGGAVQSGTAPVVSGQGAHQVEFWSTDVAGNVEVAQTVEVRIDVQAPSISASVSPAPNTAGWNNGPVTVTFLCGDEDGGSGVAFCPPEQSFTDEVDTTVTGTVADGAGNTASAQRSVRIDLTAPVVVANLPVANADGWFNVPVQVPFTCADTGGSGIATCPDPMVIAGDGADQPVSGEAVDGAGNTASTSGATVSLDTVLPTISGAAVQPANGDGTHHGTVTVRWTCDDALSGVVSCPADVDVSGEGVHVVTRSVTDRAGNTASAEVTVRISRDPSTDPGSIHGMVTNAATGQAAPGVQVGLFKASTGAQVATTTTGTDGSYVFALVDDGSYKISATKWGTYLQRWYPATNDIARATPVTVVHGDRLAADMALAPGHVIRGTLTGPDGSPIGGATVLANTGTAVKTDASGTYEMAGIPNGSYTLRAIAVGYVTGTASASFSGLVSTTLTIDRQLAAQPASTGMKGTITSVASGAPLAGATVRIWAKDAISASVTVTTGTDGRFELPNLPIGDYQVDVVRGDYAARWAADSAGRSGAATITLTAACAATPDATWGSPCATPVNVRMRKPGT